MANDNPYARRKARQSFGGTVGSEVGQTAGAAIGGALGPVGAAVGGLAGRALGGVAGRALGSLGKDRGVAPGYRKYVKDMFQKAQEGKLVDDREKVGFERQAQQAAEQTLQAQIQAANQAAMAGGPVQAGLMKETAQQIARTGTGAQVKAKGAAEQFSAALEEKRRAEALNAAQQMMAQDEALGEMARDRALGEAEILGSAATDIFDTLDAQALAKATQKEEDMQKAAARATSDAASMIKGLF